MLRFKQRLAALLWLLIPASAVSIIYAFFASILGEWETCNWSYRHLVMFRASAIVLAVLWTWIALLLRSIWSKDRHKSGRYE